MRLLLAGRPAWPSLARRTKQW